MDLVDFRMFQTNIRGWSFEIQESCEATKARVNCSLVFDKTSNSSIVSRFGYFGHAEFQSDPDIAGVGIFSALLCQAFFLWLLALISVCARGRRDKKERDNRFALFFSISDISTILSLVYVFNFVAKGKCTMSVYHYYVALDSVLIACSTMVIAFASSGRHFWRTWAVVPRVLLTILAFSFLGVFLGNQMLKRWDNDFPSWEPPNIRFTHDSAILLPVSCFLDPDFVEMESPYSPRRQNPLTEVQLNRIGQPVKTQHLPQFWIYCFLVVALAMGIFAHIIEIVKRRRTTKNPQKYQYGTRRSIGEGLLWTFIFLVCLVTNVFCAWHISGLRTWTRNSGWMKDAAEDGFYSIGQLLPIFSLVIILLALLERFTTTAFGNWVRSTWPLGEKQSRSDGYHSV